MPERHQLTEARTQLLAEATGTPGRFRVQLIDSGWGSSGYYSPEVLSEAATSRVFGAGLHMYADHPHGDGSGVDQRGNRSVRDLWAVLESDATLNQSGALVADVRVFGPYRELVQEMAQDIGLSIRAVGTYELGEAEGRRGQIITSIEAASSVDFVSAAGRGGRILEVIESAQGEALTETTARAQLHEARNVGQWIESRLHLSLTQIADEMFGDGRLTREERIALSGAVGDGLTAFTASLEQSAPQLYTRDLWTDPATVEESRLAEATANDTREALATAVNDAYRVAEKTWAWVRDFDSDAAVVYFDVSGEETGTFQQGYTLNDAGEASLTGERTEVVVRTTYVPVGTPAGGRSTTTESQGGTMPEIEEARLRQLEADAGRVQTLETELSTATTRADTAERRLAESDARNDARPIVAAVLAESTTVPAAVQARIVGEVVEAAPVTETGDLDEAALRTAAETARTAAETEIAQVLEAHGVGKPRNLGGTSTKSGEVSESAYDQRSASVFGRTSVKGA